MIVYRTQGPAWRHGGCREASKQSRKPERNSTLIGPGGLRQKRNRRNCDCSDQSWPNSSGKCQMLFHSEISARHGVHHALTIANRPYSKYEVRCQWATARNFWGDAVRIVPQTAEPAPHICWSAVIGCKIRFKLTSAINRGDKGPRTKPCQCERATEESAITCRQRRPNALREICSAVGCLRGFVN